MMDLNQFDLDHQEMKIILFGPIEIATMIIDNFDLIDEKYYAKIGLINKVEKVGYSNG